MKIGAWKVWTEPNNTLCWGRIHWGRNTVLVDGPLEVWRFRWKGNPWRWLPWHVPVDRFRWEWGWFSLHLSYTIELTKRLY